MFDSRAKKREYHAILSKFYALSTLPDFKHEVHTYIFLAAPFTLIFTDLMFERHILFDLL